jgi:hypothetical protein
MDPVSLSGWRVRWPDWPWAQISRVLILFGAFLPLPQSQAADDPGRASGQFSAAESFPDRVGELGDVERLAIEGAQTFSPQVIRNALRMAPGFLLRSHPAAPFPPYLEALDGMIMAAYQAAGFSDPHVAATYDREGKRIVVRIDEGPRFNNGEIEVKGAKTVDVERLKRRLTEPYPPPEATIPKSPGDSSSPATEPRATWSWGNGPGVRVDRAGREIQVQPPVWEPGKPASFHSTMIASLTTALTNGLADLGYLFPTIKVTVVPESKNQTARCVVDMLDEGPRDTVDEIEVIGNRRNSRDSIVQLAGLARGKTLDQRLISDAELLLWGSGRFLSQSVTAVRADSNSSKIKLRIEVLEQEGVPSLATDLSPEEKALLRFRDWLAAFRNQEDDLVAGFSDPSMMLLDGLQFEAIVSPRHGLVFSASRPMRPPTDARKYFLVLSDHGAEWATWPGQARLLLTNAFQVLFSADYRTTTNQDKASLLEIQGGLRGGSELASNEHETFKLETSFAPAAFLRLAHDTNLSVKMDGDQLTVRSQGTNGSSLLQLDARSGRVLGFEMGGPQAGSGYRIHFEKGAFDRRVREVQAETSGQPEVVVAQRPVSSIVSLLGGEILQANWFYQLTQQKRSEQQWRGLATVLPWLCNPNTLAPLDELLAQALGPEGDRFYVPEPPATADQAQNVLLAGMSAVAFRYFDEMMPKQSWPATIAREAVCLLKGQPKYTDAEMQRVYQSDIGPIGCLTVAKLLTRVHSPAARMFATHGLVRLTLEDFQKDYRLFLDGDFALAHSIRNIAAALGSMPKDQIDGLAGALPPEAADSVREAARLLRQSHGPDVPDALGQALDLYWKAALKDRVRAQLMDLIRARP